MKSRLFTHSLIIVVFIICFNINPLPVFGGSNFTLVPDKKSVEMGLRFGDDTITFHGSLPQKEAALVIRVESENNPLLKLVRKGRVVIFWMSVKQFEVSNVPFLYKIICSGNLNEVLSENLRKELHIGYEALKESMEIELLKGAPTEDDKEVVFDGFVKMKEKFGLYEVVENAVEIKDGLSFTFDLAFSDRAGEGNYTVECFAIQGKEIVGEAKETITIEKVGLTRWLTNMAHHYSALYGIMAVIVAISVGLAVGFIFKGGGH
ncbi:MAG: TIGR02186 family protein [Deltaproteobacteria bacterium]|nr:TIGR02186 family protein [Deltaproteobacteria bacterium]